MRQAGGTHRPNIYGNNKLMCSAAQPDINAWFPALLYRTWTRSLDGRLPDSVSLSNKLQYDSHSHVSNYVGRYPLTIYITLSCLAHTPTPLHCYFDLCGHFQFSVIFLLFLFSWYKITTKHLSFTINKIPRLPGFSGQVEPRGKAICGLVQYNKNICMCQMDQCCWNVLRYGA